MSTKAYTRHSNILVPDIRGAKGGKGGGGSEPREDPNSLFSTDILFIVVGIGEGPIYRINPNGPQDIEIQDGSIDDLINLDGDGLENTEKFKTLSTTGTTTQDRLDVFGETVTTPQQFVSPVTLKKGNLDGVPSSKVTLQETSPNDWDALKFNFLIPQLQQIKKNGDVLVHEVAVKVTVFNRLGTLEIASGEKTITGKTNTPFKFSMTVVIPEGSRSTDGYRFTIEKLSDDNDSSSVQEVIKSIGWFEIENSAQAYPRTAHIGYALKAVDEHTNGIPTFTSLIKGLLVRVPSNYNQPILANGEIDWREVEVASTGVNSIGNGYRLQQTGTGTVLTGTNPNIYVGAWDGTFVYSWTQNPVWIIYDILTNKTYGLGIPEENIDKFRFYQVAQYCDACDSVTGNFIGVDGLADGTFRHKPRNLFTTVRENQIGVPQGSKIKERRFVMDVTISDENPTMDTLNSLAGSFRSAIVYSHGKLTLASDLPDELPLMSFTEANIKDGSFVITGGKDSDVLTAVEVSYVDPTNHYKREVVRIDEAGRNDGVSRNVPENMTSLDLPGVTRRSQALRFGQYQIASSKFLKRSVNFTTSTDALSLVPGDVISISQNQTGINYGFGGKISSNSHVGGSNANVFLEHFTVPSLADTNFTANTGPLALRIYKMADDRMDLYLLSNTAFALTSSDNVTSGKEFAEVNIIQRFNPITKTFTGATSFAANNSPVKGDLWSFGEIVSTDNFYTNKAGKLFKVTSMERVPENEEVNIGAIEYVSNVYVDSDTFIDYKPTAYTDIQSAFSVPPPPNFNLQAVPRALADGSITVDGRITESTETDGFGLTFATEFFVSRPDETTLVANAVHGSSLTLNVATANTISAAATPVQLVGKNGFTTPVGEIKLLCNSVSVVDTAGGTLDGNVQLTLEGLNVAFDENFFKHVLDVNDLAVFGGLKGTDFVSIPINEKTSTQGLLNFVGFAPIVTEVSQNIAGFDKVNNTVKFENRRTGAQTISEVLPTAPFFVTINQLLDARFYNNNSFYVSGSEFTYVEEGDFSTHPSDLELAIKPLSASFVRFFVDGVEKSSGQFTVNLNKGATQNANISYSRATGDTTFRAEVDHYTVPVIEVGDNLQSASGNVFPVVNTSYDPASLAYNAALTANSIFRVELGSTPKSNLAGLTFINISPDPIGTINNVSGGSCTLDFDSSTFPGNFRLSNNRVYNLNVGAEFEKQFLLKDLTIPNLPIGVTTVRARNKTRMGRFSPFSTKSVTVEALPIQKVTGLAVTESLYREQTGGVAVRATCQFTHITGQQVTDYEISYRLDNIDNVGTDDGGADLTSFNTVKVPASGVDSDGKIRFTVNGINRGTTSDTNSIIFRVTPLNKDIRGVTATASKSIIGKTAKPANVFNFTGGQQTDQVTLLWTYERQTDGELLDLDLKEVVIRRAPGSVDLSLENFIAAEPLVTVSAGTARKSIPIDIFGEFTYLVRTRDTSGNFSESVTGITLTTTRPARATVVAAFNEDSPSVAFAGIPNTNLGESNFPSFADSNTGGLSFNASATGGAAAAFNSSLVDNANGTSTGFSAISGSSTDLLAVGDGVYITQIRDFGATITGSIQVDIEATQEIQSTFNDEKTVILQGVTEESTAFANVLHDVNFGGIGHVLGVSNASVSSPRFDANNETFMSGGADGNVFAIVNDGQFVGNVIPVSTITKATTARVTTTGSEHGISSTGAPGTRVIVHDIEGMTEINDRELFAKRINATTVDLFTDVALTSGLNSSGFGTFTSGGVLDQGDYSNANAFAFIAGTVNATAIELGASFFANGDPTGSNAFANITNTGNTYKLVNLIQFNDKGSGDTFAGTLGAISSQTLIRTTAVDNVALYPNQNGNVDISQFTGSSVNEGFQAYQAGSRTFRQFQLKFIVNNSQPDQFDFTIDKFRYTIEKDIVTFTDTVVHDGSPKTVNYTSAGFLNRPVLTYTVLDQLDAEANPAVVVTTAASNQSASFKLIASDGTGEYLGNSSANVMIVAQGV